MSERLKKNILFSTTRQWNPGDEFILFGIINLLSEILGDFNSIIYNRNPEVRQLKSYLNPFRTIKWSNYSFSGKKNIESFFRIGFYDNSFKDELDASFIDYVIFAGTPEWMGRRCSSLYHVITKYTIPTLFLGIGNNNDKMNFDLIKDRYKKVLKSSKLIIVRDERTKEILKPLHPVKLSCPALFSSKRKKEILSISRVGLIFATDKAVVHNRINSETFQYLVELYKAISKIYSCEIVCHYIDELPEAFKLFPELAVNYSYDSKDYLDIYYKFDFVIGPRIHGIGVGASCGIPGMLLAHDLRADTAKGFGAEIISVGQEVSHVLFIMEEKKNSVQRLTENLQVLKMDMKKAYLKLLMETLF